MANLMPDVDDSTDEEMDLSDRHDGVDIESSHIQATFEYNVTISAEQQEDMPDSIPLQQFACDLACSRARKEYDLTFSVNDVVAQKDDRCMVAGEDSFTVLVRTSQNR